MPKTKKNTNKNAAHKQEIFRVHMAEMVPEWQEPMLSKENDSYLK